LASAIDWLHQYECIGLDDRRTMSLNVETDDTPVTTATNKNIKLNKGIPLGILKKNIGMWRFTTNAIKDKNVASRVLAVIKDGFKLDSINGRCQRWSGGGGV